MELLAIELLESGKNHVILWTYDSLYRTEYNSEVHMVLLLPITQVWNQNGRTPYITFEYTVLRDSLPPVPPPPVYTGSDTSAGEVSAEVGGLLAPNSSIYDQAAPEGHLDSGGEVQKGQETNEVYEESAAIDCDQDAAAAPKYSGRGRNNVTRLYEKEFGSRHRFSGFSFSF